MKRHWNIQKIEDDKIPAPERKLFSKLRGCDADGYVDIFSESINA